MRWQPIPGAWQRIEKALGPRARECSENPPQRGNSDARTHGWSGAVARVAHLPVHPRRSSIASRRGWTAKIDWIVMALVASNIRGSGRATVRARDVWPIFFSLAAVEESVHAQAEACWRGIRGDSTKRCIRVWPARRKPQLKAFVAAGGTSTTAASRGREYRETTGGSPWCFGARHGGRRQVLAPGMARVGQGTPHSCASHVDPPR